MDYTGRIITKNQVVPTASSAPGIWTLDEAMQYTKQGKWPPGYQISRSVRLRSSASAYFNRTTGSPTSSFTFTHSFWVKRGALGANQALIAGARPTNFDRIYIQSNDTLLYQWNDGTSNLANIETTQVFRDPSAWYHFVFATDTTQATAANRVKIYVNGVQITALTSTTYPAQNSASYFNTGSVALNVGRSTNASMYFDGYLTEINFVDGQALTPASFGYTDTATGVWQPAPYNGTYGNNGFYLNFKDPTSTTTIGYDYSGNSNNWTANNISVTAGTTYDSMVDVPINWGTDTGVGGEVRGNYAVMNPLDQNASLPAPTNGNLNLSNAASAWFGIRSTMAVTSGKWYAEVTQTGSNSMAGVMSAASALTFASYTGATGIYGFFNNGAGTAGYPYSNGSSGTTFTIASGDVIGLAYDFDAQTLAIYRNGALQATVTSIPKTTPMFFCAFFAQTTATQAWNFGQRAFANTAPSGFKALCTQNLPVPTILNGANYNASTLYTGNGGTLSVSNGANNTSGTTFQPDLVWIKSRSAATDNKLTDSVRGVTKGLVSNTTAAETTDTNGLTAFGSSGFTVGTDTVYNNSGATYVGWQWKASGSTVSNTTGSITSTVNANTTVGFSILTYTGNGTVGATVGHGLGVTPGMVIVKSRSATADWPVKILPYMTGGQRLELSTTNAITTEAAGSGSLWNATNPNSTVITLGNQAMTNTNGTTYVAYCWATISGYSAFGSYTGNGAADGPFVYLGFRPRWLLIKRTDGVDSWVIEDSSRDTYNVNTKYLLADSSTAEGTGTPPQLRDFLSNGFKPRSTNQNASGGTYIYAAFAENPFTLARAR